ncbi:unnamed protein product [Heligmosomoides polygyrus]|uniref:HTH_48 domain-containing protein n=1 Tax=Heligmosomoides polygyrus TaxID=6339 RepID=A0A183FYM8_HELPZ|nr:unnamed protein product [Heligmosomoides polygyrus]
MLRWTAGVTRMDRIRNDAIRQKFGVVPMADRMREARLRWYDHVRRGKEDSGLEGARMDLKVAGVHTDLAAHDTRGRMLFSPQPSPAGYEAVSAHLPGMHISPRALSGTGDVIKIRGRHPPRKLLGKRQRCIGNATLERETSIGISCCGASPRLRIFTTTVAFLH